jgi:hypothetical protein
MAVPTNYLVPENTVSIIRGTNKTIRVTVTNPDTTATNLTGGKLVLSVKDGLYQDLPLIQKLTTDAAQAVITKPREGLVEFYFVPADTQGLTPKDYIFDIWLITATGDRYAVVTPTTFTVTPGVTYLPL